MSSRQRPSLKGQGSEIFFPADEDADETEALGPRSSRDDEAPQTPLTSANMAGNRRYSGEMKKLTFNLPLELSFALEELRLNLRRATHSGVTKTEIVQAALERTLREYQEDGVDSQLLADLGFEVSRSEGSGTAGHDY